MWLLVLWLVSCTATSMLPVPATTASSSASAATWASGTGTSERAAIGHAASVCVRDACLIRKGEEKWGGNFFAQLLSQASTDNLVGGDQCGCDGGLLVSPLCFRLPVTFFLFLRSFLFPACLNTWPVGFGVVFKTLPGGWVVTELYCICVLCSARGILPKFPSQV